MRRRADDTWRGSGDTGGAQDARNVGGSGTWPTTAGERRLRLRDSREGSYRRTGESCWSAE